MYERYRDRAAFLFVYIREAHPSDGWQMPANESEHVVFEQPRTKERRTEIAGACCRELKLAMPCVVDAIDNHVDSLYAAWPERMFVVDATGRLAYVGEPGPFGFKPEEVAHWLERNAAR